MTKWYTYWFQDLESGEEFFVEIQKFNLQSAYQVAHQYFEKPRFIDMVSEEQAEMMGLDTY